ncbi:phosphohistidine phosphatase SixA [Cellvibrio sp. OA-2007]|uniref:phosphohistidine phosphatase SixA n=1 Tax=Cellvibrio sp. OA-2007 TaxID=529823 RepID=UPI000780466C|nr:phosphohistidine phosphatase SixA [Cellvibrio sp. OA-2007]
MTIFILRHGQAEAQISTDEARQLTDKGRSDTARVVQARIADMNPLMQIWASPLVRAQQTAVIAAGYFSGIAIQTTELLVPEANPQALIKWLGELNARSSSQSILLVSHQPLVGSLVNMLCSKPEHYYPMGTSSLAAIRAELIAADMGDLLWLDHA